MARIGFVGLGNMGLPMAANLVAAGHEVRGFDVAGPARTAFNERGGIGCETAANAVSGCDAVLTMLPAGQHVRAVLVGRDGILEKLSPGTLVVDCSTIDPPTARAMHEAADERGLLFLDAPVSGGISGAAAGTLTFMVGGGSAALDRARPFLERMGRTIVHAGAAGAGQAAKICNNMILGISMAAVGEAFALAEKLGLSAQALFDVASKSSGQCWALTAYCPVPGPVPQSPANRDYVPGFAAALMAKDMALAVQAEREAGAASLLAPLAQAAYDAVVGKDLGDKDFSIIAKLLRDGIPVATPPSSPADGGAE